MKAMQEEDAFQKIAKEQYNTDAEGLAKIVVQLARDRVLAEWNVNYEENLDDVREKISKTVITFHERNYLDKDIKKFKENKIVVESKFYTGTDLLLREENGDYVRGTLKFCFKEPTSKEWLEKYIDKSTGKPIVKGKWYQADVRVGISWGDSSNIKKGILTARLEFLNQKGKKIYVIPASGVK